MLEFVLLFIDSLQERGGLGGWLRGEGCAKGGWAVGGARGRVDRVAVGPVGHYGLEGGARWL